MVWQTGDALAHPLLAHIGPEPLSDTFDGAWLYRITLNLCRDWIRKQRRTPVSQVPEGMELSDLAGEGIIPAYDVVVHLLEKAGGMECTLATDGADRFLFDGAYVVDNFALVLKALFLGVGYVVLLMSTNYIEDGDYIKLDNVTLGYTFGEGALGRGKRDGASDRRAGCDRRPRLLTP